MVSEDMVRVSLDLSPEMFGKLEILSKELHTTKSNLLRKALFLAKTAIDVKKHGNKLAIVNQENKYISEFFNE